MALDRPALEVTEEMVEAGLAALFPSSVLPWEVPAEVVTRVFDAMLRAWPDQGWLHTSRLETPRSLTPSPSASPDWEAFRAETVRGCEGE